MWQRLALTCRRQNVCEAEVCMPRVTIADKYHVNTSVTGRSGFIMSPHYPLSYPHNVNYTYLFHINRTDAIELQFHSFNVEGKTTSYYLDTCHYDWLTVSSSY